MNEQEIFKKSIKTFIGGEIALCLLSIVLKNVSWALGFALGYLVSLCIFWIIIKIADLILLLKGRTVSIIVVMHLMKTVVYAIGMLLAIKMPQVFNLITVVLGYFTIQLTIYIETYRQREVT